MLWVYIYELQIQQKCPQFGFKGAFLCLMNSEWCFRGFSSHKSSWLNAEWKSSVNTLVKLNIPAVDLHRPRGSPEVCRAASLFPSPWSSSQVCPPLPSSALWNQHTPSVKQYVMSVRQFVVPCLYLTCGSSTAPCTRQTRVRPCPRPPRWPGRTAALSTWSGSGRYSSCPRWETQQRRGRIYFQPRREKLRFFSGCFGQEASAKYDVSFNKWSITGIQ